LGSNASKERIEKGPDFRGDKKCHEGKKVGRLCRKRNAMHCGREGTSGALEEKAPSQGDGHRGAKGKKGGGQEYFFLKHSATRTLSRERKTRKRCLSNMKM